MNLAYEKTNKIFEENWNKYYNIIFRKLVYITGSVELAKDIAQEVFEKLYYNPPSHDNVEAWLKRISSNIAFNYLRNEKLRTKKKINLLNDINSIASAEEEVLNKIENNLVKKVLNKLKSKDRLCLLLKFSGYRYKEISSIMQINQQSVGKVLSRAQVKFKKLYEKEVGKNDLQK